MQTQAKLDIGQIIVRTYAVARAPRVTEGEGVMAEL